MRKLILLMFAIYSSFSFAQNEATDAFLLSLIDDVPLLNVEPSEVALSPSIAIDGIAGASVDHDGNILIFQRNAEIDPIIVVNQDGLVLRSFGYGDFERPHSVRVDPVGNVWAVDSQASKIVKYSSSGKKILEINVGDIPDPDQVSCGASDITFGSNGNLYVTDGYCNARIIVYDAGGRKINQWGVAGTGPGEFNLPHGLVLGPDGNLYIADRENGRIQIFSVEGEYLDQWVYGGRVLDIAFTSTGDLYLSVEPKDAEPMQEAMFLQLSPVDGSIIGRINDFGHQIAIGPDGILMPATMGEPIRFYKP